VLARRVGSGRGNWPWERSKAACEARRGPLKLPKEPSIVRRALFELAKDLLMPRKGLFERSKVVREAREALFEARKVLFEARSVLFEAREVLCEARKVPFEARQVLSEARRLPFARSDFPSELRKPSAARTEALGELPQSPSARWSALPLLPTLFPARPNALRELPIGVMGLQKLGEEPAKALFLAPQWVEEAPHGLMERSPAPAELLSTRFGELDEAGAAIGGVRASQNPASILEEPHEAGDEHRMESQRAGEVARAPWMILADEGHEVQDLLLGRRKARAGQRRLPMALVEVGAAEQERAGVGRDVVGIDDEGAVEVVTHEANWITRSLSIARFGACAENSLIEDPMWPHGLKSDFVLPRK
jgi:hypothetical protein